MASLPSPTEVVEIDLAGPATFADQVAGHHARLHRLAHACTGDADAAARLTEGTLTAARRAWPELRRRPDLDAELVRRLFARDTARPGGEVPIDLDEPLVVWRAVALLPPEKRQALALAELDPRGRGAVADVLGLSLVGTGARLTTARHQLAEILGVDPVTVDERLAAGARALLDLQPAPLDLAAADARRRRRQILGVLGAFLAVVLVVVVTAGLDPDPALPKAAGPVESTDARALPPRLELEPATALTDGQVVDVVVRRAPAGSFIGRAWLCAEGGAPDELGCRWLPGGVISSSRGEVRAEVQLWRRIVGEAPGAGPATTVVDCASAPCELVVRLAGEELRTGVDFDPDAPLAPPEALVVDRTSGLADGQEVRVQVPGVAFELPTVLQCVVGSDVCGFGFGAVADPDGGVRLRVFRRIVTSEGPHDCVVDGPCELRVAGESVTVGRIEPARLEFEPDGPPAPGPSVTVEPTSGLADGETVTVRGRAQSTGPGIEVHQCGLSSAWAGPCFNLVGLAPVGADGDFATEVVVRRRVSAVDGPVDCAAEPVGCVLIVREPGGLWATEELGFDPTVPARPDPVVTIAHLGGELYRVRGEGFAPPATPGLDPAVALLACEGADTTAGRSPASLCIGLSAGAPLDGTGSFDVEVVVPAELTVSEVNTQTPTRLPDSVIDCRSVPCAVHVRRGPFQAETASVAFQPG